MAQSRLTVSILNWNGLELTRQCLRSLLVSTVVPDKIIVLDNGSDQNEAAVLRTEFSTHPVTILRSETNLGFAGGNNYVIKQLQTETPAETAYDYIMLLNQDATVEPKAIQQLIAYLDTQPNIAVAGPLVLNPTGTIQSCGADINRWTGKIISRKQNQTRNTAPAAPELVDCVIGNCFVMRTSALNSLGLLDEQYFAYYEEADWCRRATAAGKNCAVVPSAIIQHSKSGGFRTYLVTRNMIWFQKRYATAPQLVGFFIYFWGYFIFERLKKGSPLSDLIRAAKDGWLNRNIGKA